MTNYVVCLKWGTKYSADYVNKLYSMTQRNLTVAHTFICFTDDTTDIHPDIETRSLPKLPVEGWWFKPMFFNPAIGLNGTILFLDLDLVIFENIDGLFNYEPGKFVIIRDFNRSLIPNYQKFNSSIFRLTTGAHQDVYLKFLEDPKGVSNRFQGDQDWIYHTVKTDYAFWPDSWIQSYKWESRKRAQLDRTKSKGFRDFATVGDPVFLKDTKVAVFHGDPNPHNCKDPWVKENWR